MVMKRPLAYITAPWSDNEFENTETAAKYCRAVYEAGFSPVCPLLFLPLFLADSIPQEHKDGIDMARDYLRRSHVLVVCGDTVDESMKNDIPVHRFTIHIIDTQTKITGSRRFVHRGDFIGGVLHRVGSKCIPLPPSVAHLARDLRLQRDHAAFVLVGTGKDLLSSHGSHRLGHASGGGITGLLLLRIPDDEGIVCK